MAQISPQPGILDISPYVGGEGSLAGQDNVLKLSANENPAGPPESAKAALIEAAAGMHVYPSTDHAGLRSAIAEVHGLEAERIICGVGSDEILHLLCQTYVGAGDEVIHTEHGFAIYRICTLAAGGTPVAVPERERVTDVASILGAVTPATKIVFIANPNNPTGTMIGPAELAALAEGLPDGVLLVLDGAYAEFVGDYDGGASLVAARSNVVMTRTFSKLYGLGGLRVGWGYAPAAVIDALNRVRGPFNLSGPALAAAEAAIRDRPFAERTRTENARLRAWLHEALGAIGIPSDTSMANFILARFASTAEAEAADDHLRDQGIIVRRVSSYGLPQCLRITIGDEAACRRVADALAAFKEKG